MAGLPWTLPVSSLSTERSATLESIRTLSKALFSPRILPPPVEKPRIFLSVQKMFPSAERFIDLNQEAFAHIIAGIMAFHFIPTSPSFPYTERGVKLHKKRKMQLVQFFIMVLARVEGAAPEENYCSIFSILWAKGISYTSLDNTRALWCIQCEVVCRQIRLSFQ